MEVKVLIEIEMRDSSKPANKWVGPELVEFEVVFEGDRDYWDWVEVKVAGKDGELPEGIAEVIARMAESKADLIALFSEAAAERGEWMRDYYAEAAEARAAARAEA